ncbi:MAG: F0F1 ATP synthase subunit epsilon [Bacteroidetes bacterium ADurb.Bin037]|nr:MAG: F0F1 ATP synthase subunit epsilon [Bacteroidetes bacterium ADurb.Bin037]HPW79057.1 hypothetical protein [Bacteroidales bacterium]HQB56687.1 hypothetical protein [Bacteroidales bacterium]
METQIFLQVISTEKILFQGNVSVVRFMGGKTSFTVLRDHAPIMSLLDKGYITFDGDFGKKKIPMSSGFVQVKKNEVYACIEQKGY